MGRPEKEQSLCVHYLVRVEGMNEVLQLPNYSLLTTIRVPPSPPTYAEIFTFWHIDKSVPYTP